MPENIAAALAANETKNQTTKKKLEGKAQGASEQFENRTVAVVGLLRGSVKQKCIILARVKKGGDNTVRYQYTHTHT